MYKNNFKTYLILVRRASVNIFLHFYEQREMYLWAVNPQATNVIYIYIYIYIYMEHLFLMFLDHTQRRSTVGRTPLDE